MCICRAYIEIILVSKMTNAGINHMGAFFFGQKLHHVFFFKYLSSKFCILAVKISNVGINLADAFFS